VCVVCVLCVCCVCVLCVCVVCVVLCCVCVVCVVFKRSREQLLNTAMVDAYKGEAYNAVQKLVRLIKSQHYFNRHDTHSMHHTTRHDTRLLTDRLGVA
jgi:hypothetical protein